MIVRATLTRRPRVSSSVTGRVLTRSPMYGTAQSSQVSMLWSSQSRSIERRVMAAWPAITSTIPRSTSGFCACPSSVRYTSGISAQTFSV